MLRLYADNLSAPSVRHGFFGRTGGVSDGIYASLNCGLGSGDAKDKVLENRLRIARAIGGVEVHTLYQIHSPTAVIARADWDEAPQADAMASKEPGLVLGILTADCAPVLLADAEAGVIGAAHAGWKGALFGVIPAILDLMESLGARRERIAAAIGPCISQSQYEVGAEFKERFLRDDPGSAQFFSTSKRADHFHFALEPFVFSRLRQGGLENIHMLSACTYSRNQDFFSFRRTTHLGEPDYGRQISAIMLAR